MTRLTYILGRLAQIVPTFLLTLVLVFALVRFLPGDAVTATLGDHATDEAIRRLQDQLGLGKPFLVQFTTFLERLAHGDLGESLVLKVKVADLIIQRLPVTLFLTGLAALLALVISLPLAFLAALRRGSAVDSGMRSAFQIALSMPVFYIGLVLLKVLAADLRWFPVGGFGTGFLDDVYHLILPALTLALSFSAVLMRNLRSAVIEVLEAEYVDFARAKGLGERLVLGRHVLRNALVSTVTLFGLQIGTLIGGAVITETVFAIPGVGRLMIDAIFGRDYPVVQAMTLVLAVLVSLVFLATDLVHSWLDPRTAR
jgi:peptide/nickel transport system permease protein